MIDEATYDCELHLRPQEKLGVNTQTSCATKKKGRKEGVLHPRVYLRGVGKSAEDSFPAKKHVVREGGVEPPPHFWDTDLNRARLPIPPLARALKRLRAKVGARQMEDTSRPIVLEYQGVHARITPAGALQQFPQRRLRR